MKNLALIAFLGCSLFVLPTTSYGQDSQQIKANPGDTIEAEARGQKDKVKVETLATAVEIVFLQRQDEQLVETDALYVKGAFYVKVTFDQKPAVPSRKVTLTFNTGQTKTVEVSASSFGPKVYDTSPLHLSQLENFPKLPDDTPSPAPKVQDPNATKYPYKTTVVLKYEEVIEASPENSPQSISASIDDKKANANIIMRGATVNATLEIPIELKLHEAEGEIPYFYLTQDGPKLKIDDAMPQSSTAILMNEKQDVEKKLDKWRIPMDENGDLFRDKWIKEGIVTFLIDEPFSELVKFSKPQETLSKERALNLDGKDLVPVIKMLYARLMQECALEKRVAELMERLKEGNAGIESAVKLNEVLEQNEGGLEELDKYFTDYGTALANPYLVRFDANSTNKKIAEYSAQKMDLERRIDDKLNNLRIKMSEPITVTNSGRINAVKQMESLKRTISQLENFIGDPSAGTTESQINDIRRKVNIRKVQVTQIESIIEDETSFFRNRIKELEAKIKKEEQVLVDGPQASREAKKIVDDFDRSYYPKWKAYTKLVNDIKNNAVGIKGLIVPNFPSLPDSRNGLTTQKLYKAANALIETRKNLIVWTDKNENALEADFVAYLEAQASYRNRLVKVTEAMSVAISEARSATNSGSQAEEDTFKILGEELDRMKSTIDEASSLYSASDSRLEKFEKLLDFANSQKGKGLVKKARDNMETLGKVAGRFEKYANYADMLKRGVELYDEGKPDDYLKYSLEMAGKVGAKLKVRGTVLGDFLGFYAEAGAASLKAAHVLRDKFVEQSLAATFDSKGNGRPEKRLYTRQQIKNAIHHGAYGYDAQEKIIHVAVMWQLRRLMYLLFHASDCGDIRDGGGLKY